MTTRKAQVEPLIVTMTLNEYRALTTEGKSKYNNQRVVADGYTFDSKAEYEYYLGTLKPLLQAGAISELLVHPRYKLVVNNQLICTYEADFSFFDEGEKRVRVQDVKGVRTDVFKLKQKLVKACLGIEIEEIAVHPRRKRKKAA